MCQFPVALQLGEDPSSGDVVLGFVHDDMFVFDPYSSSCGRFEVNPTETYGLAPDVAEKVAALNRLLRSATEDVAKLAVCRAHLAVELGVGLPSDASGQPPVDDAARQAIARAIATEMLVQLGQLSAGAMSHQTEAA